MASKQWLKRFIGAAIALWALAAASAAQAQHVDESQLQGLHWRQIGPFQGGRSITATGIPGNSSVFYFGAVSGGVWKTANGGLTWEPTFDKEPVSSIGSIAVAESDPNVIYAGTGEACIRGNISYGDGVYKSIDAGKTWTNVGLKDTRHIGAVIVDPHDANIVFVAALGHVYGTNTERGVFRSRDGGKTWDKVLYKDEKTGGIDIVFDPQNSNTLFAALWEARRTPWSLTSGGPGSGLYKSIDGGTTWKQIEGHGFPEGVLGRIGISVSGADSNRVYALVEAAKGGLYSSEDSGDTWELINADQRFRQRAWYFTHVFADPKSVDTVYVLNTGMFRSTNGGKDFTRVSAGHGDHHDLWIDPTDPNRMINANDGGAAVTQDGGKTWTTLMNQPTAQFYHVAVDSRYPYHVYGAQQDSGTVAIASDTNHGSIDRQDWYDVGGGESGYVVPDPTNPDVVYAGSYFGEVTRFDKSTGEVQDISPWPDDPDGRGAVAAKYRFTWTQPIVISPHDPNTLYYAGNVLFRSKDAGMTWSVISPDLSRNDKTKQQSSGGPITKDNSSAEFYDLIFTVTESPAQQNVIWAGTDDGLVHITRDGGTTWTSVTPPGTPEWGLVSLIDASWHDGGTAYVAVDARKLDDFHPYIFRTHKYGAVWKNISDGIPEGSYVHAVREDPEHGGLLFAGTETGVFLSFDDGEHWQPLKLNLPTTPVHDLAIKNSDLIVATHGRSFWILDDISPLRQFEEMPRGASAFLFKPRPAIRSRLGAPGPASHLNLAGELAPHGATLYYWLKDKPDEKELITLEILDSAGKTVRKFTSQAKKKEENEDRDEDEKNESAQEVLTTSAGLNRFVWDLRYDKPREIPNAIYDEGDPLGALALPGDYQLKLTAGGKSYTQPLEIRLDPRIKTSGDDLQKQFDLVGKIGGIMDRAHLAVLQMRSVHEQIAALSKRLQDDEAAQPILDTAHALDKQIMALADEIAESKVAASEEFLNYPIDLNSRLGYLQNAADSADSAPTQQEYDVEAELEGLANDDLAKWQDLQDKDLAALNETMKKAYLPMIGIVQEQPKEKEKQEQPQ